MMGGGPLDRGKVVLRDGAYSCETLTMVLGGASQWEGEERVKMGNAIVVQHG